MPLEANTPGTRITSYCQILIGAIAILIGRIASATPLPGIGVALPAATVQQKCPEAGPKGGQSGLKAPLHVLTRMPVLGGLLHSVVAGLADETSNRPVLDTLSGYTTSPCTALHPEAKHQ